MNLPEAGFSVMAGACCGEYVCVQAAVKCSSDNSGGKQSEAKQQGASDEPEFQWKSLIYQSLCV